jgi:hypothetical protein
MANIKAIIKKKNKNNQDTNVYISYYRNSKEKAILSAGVKCNPSDWNPEKEEIRKSDPLHKEKNELIGRRKQRVIAVQNEYELQDRELSIDQLKASYNEWLKGSDKIKDPIQAIEFMIERKQGLVKKDVIKDYNALSKHLSHFIRSNAPHAQLVDIDNEFGMRFEQFLYTEKLVPFKDTEKN